MNAQANLLALSVSAPVLRFANSIASQGYIVACPVVFHEFTGAAAIPYDVPGTDAGNAYKVQKLLTAYDEDAKKAVDLLMEHPNCTGRIGATGMCLGGHLAFRVSWSRSSVAPSEADRGSNFVERS